MTGVMRFLQISRKQRFCLLFCAVAISFCALLFYGNLPSTWISLLHPSSIPSQIGSHYRDNRTFKDNITSRYLISDFTLCEKHRPHLLIWIYSSVTHSERRMSVRQTWGNTTLYAPMRVVIVFSVAVGRQGTNMKRSLEHEQQLYGDIVQDGSFIDAYNNLSMKAESMLFWTAAFCGDVRLLLKTDDDSFLIPKRVASWLNNFDINDKWPVRSIIGNVFKSPSPYRNKKSKWYASYEEWPYDIWARKACSGSGYFISGDAVPILKNLIGKVWYVRFEDVYITGIMAERAGLSHISNSAHHYLIYKHNQTRMAVRYSRAVFIVGNIPTIKETYSFWKLVGNLTMGYNIQWSHCAYSCND